MSLDETTDLNPNYIPLDKKKITKSKLIQVKRKK